MTRPNFFAIVFFVLFIFLFYQMSQMLAPFVSALIWGVLLTFALYPLHKRILRLLNGREAVAAFVMTLLTMLLVILPAVALLALIATQAASMYDWVSAGVQSGRLVQLWNDYASAIAQKIQSLPGLSHIDLQGMLIKGLGDVSSSLAGQVGLLLKNTLILALDILVLLIALFFFFRDGESYYRTATELLPFHPEHKEALSKKITDTFSAVLNGIFLIALMQGAVTGIGFLIFGIPYAVLWGFLAAIFALLPIGGAALIWVPGVVYLYLTGATIKAVLLLIWGVVLVSLPDNFLKPMLIGRKANIPAFFLFIGILGGLQVYGILGILFGPLVVTLLTVFIHIYREEYMSEDEE